MIRAYDELYIEGAQKTLGDAFDFALVTLDISPEIFQMCLNSSPSARQFATGNPSYTVGINGCELARMVLDDAGVSYPEEEDALYLDKSPEYWAGWAAAWAQWDLDLSFSELFEVVPIETLLMMYPTYHEMDLEQFMDEVERRRAEKKKRTGTRLRRFRRNIGLTQAELARRSGVPLRQIQLFEEEKRDINRTQAITLLRLSRALFCQMEDLIER